MGKRRVGKRRVGKRRVGKSRVGEEEGGEEEDGEEEDGEEKGGEEEGGKEEGGEEGGKKGNSSKLLVATQTNRMLPRLRHLWVRKKQWFLKLKVVPEAMAGFATPSVEPKANTTFESLQRMTGVSLA